MKALVEKAVLYDDEDEGELLNGNVPDSDTGVDIVAVASVDVDVDVDVDVEDDIGDDGAVD